MTLNQSNTERKRRNRNRLGLTVLEFVGCAIAIVGGMWLGAIYLGIDLRHVAHAALTETQLIEKMPPSWRPPGPHESMTREELVATLREELSSLRTEIAALRNQEPTVPTVSATEEFGVSNSGSEKSATALERTQAYWQRLRELARNEATLQREADASFTRENAAHVFALKARVSRVAAKAVGAVKTEHVHEAALTFAGALAEWYEHGAALYDRAVQIWEMPVHGRSQLNAEWTRGEMQHRNESQLLAEKAAGTRGTLSREFGVEFPPFAEPPASAEPPNDDSKSSSAGGNSVTGTNS